jgi:hypothetical protein
VIRVGPQISWGILLCGGPDEHSAQKYREASLSLADFIVIGQNGARQDAALRGGDINMFPLDDCTALRRSSQTLSLN